MPAPPYKERIHLLADGVTLVLEAMYATPEEVVAISILLREAAELQAMRRLVKK